MVTEGRRERARSLLGVLLVVDERLVVPERDGRGDDAQVVDEPNPVLVRAGDGEGDHPAEMDQGSGGDLLDDVPGADDGTAHGVAVAVEESC